MAETCFRGPYMSLFSSPSLSPDSGLWRRGSVSQGQEALGSTGGSLAYSTSSSAFDPLFRVVQLDRQTEPSALVEPVF